jgi:hypothetical protein
MPRRTQSYKAAYTNHSFTNTQNLQFIGKHLWLCKLHDCTSLIEYACLQKLAHTNSGMRETLSLPSRAGHDDPATTYAHRRYVKRWPHRHEPGQKVGIFTKSVSLNHGPQSFSKKLNIHLRILVTTFFSTLHSGAPSDLCNLCELVLSLLFSLQPLCLHKVNKKTKTYRTYLFQPALRHVTNNLSSGNFPKPSK